MLISSSRILSF